MRRLAMVVILVGCSEPPASDLDGDGRADAEDDCVAGFSDAVVDADGDGKDATADLCPHDFNALAGDLDFDDIPDACDPFPATAAKDTRRCVTSFRVPWMNASYLVARAGESEWDLAAPLSATAADTVSVLSTFPLAYPSVTLDVRGTIDLPTEQSSFKLWLRAHPDAPSPEDIACGIEPRLASGELVLFVWTDNTRNAAVPVPAPAAGVLRLRGTVQADGTVLCRIHDEPQAIAITFDGEPPRPDGRYGFAATAANVTIDSLVIDSNGSPQPL